MKENGEKYISWFTFNNMFPIVVSVVGLTITYGVLLSRLAIIETKLDHLSALLKSHEEQQIRVINAVNDLEHRMAVAETKINR